MAPHSLRFDPCTATDALPRASSSDAVFVRNNPQNHAPWEATLTSRCLTMKMKFQITNK